MAIDGGAADLFLVFTKGAVAEGGVEEVVEGSSCRWRGRGEFGRHSPILEGWAVESAGEG